jgi:hypothetical protein
MKVHVGRNRGFYQAYIQGNMVQEIGTSNPGKLMVCLCPLELNKLMMQDMLIALARRR